MRSKSPLCPTCARPVALGDPFFPFCSERCRLLDLGEWLGGRYRIPGPPVALRQEQEEELEQEAEDSSVQS